MRGQQWGRRAYVGMRVAVSSVRLSLHTWHLTLSRRGNRPCSTTMRSALSPAPTTRGSVLRLGLPNEGQKIR